jgi:hypothetical protein
MKKLIIFLLALLAVNGAIAQWYALSSGTTRYLSSVYFPDANTGYAVGEAGTILKTNNAGTTWTVLSSGTINYLYSVYFTDSNTGYAVGDLGTILKTSNAGTTWTALSSGTTEILKSVYFPEAYTPGISSHLSSVHFTDANTGYAVGDNGTILKTTNGGFPLGVNETSSTSNSLKIYPNPSSDKITVETSASPANKELSIMNINGQAVITRQITEPLTQISISTLPGGVYFVRMTGEQTVQSGKFVKQFEK